NSNLKERGFSYPRKSNSSGGLESPPSVSFESAQGSFEITSIHKNLRFLPGVRELVAALQGALIALEKTNSYFCRLLAVFCFLEL
ncbi:MAG: hypothetical protein WCS96_05100, partial [Victivallales bacterium]